VSGEDGTRYEITEEATAKERHISWRVVGPDGTITESDEIAPAYCRLWLAVPEISLLPTA
jgi:hypothetical protein